MAFIEVKRPSKFFTFIKYTLFISTGIIGFGLGIYTGKKIIDLQNEIRLSEFKLFQINKILSNNNICPLPKLFTITELIN